MVIFFASTLAAETYLLSFQRRRVLRYLDKASAFDLVGFGIRHFTEATKPSGGASTQGGERSGGPDVAPDGSANDGFAGWGVELAVAGAPPAGGVASCNDWEELYDTQTDTMYCHDSITDIVSRGGASGASYESTPGGEPSVSRGVQSGGRVSTCL